MRSGIVTTVAGVATLAIVLPLGVLIGARLVSPATAAGTPVSADRPAVQAVLTIPLVTHVNPILGYRIGLPNDYWRSRFVVLPADQEAVGHDAYVSRTEPKEVELCLGERQSGVQSSEREFDVRVEAYRDVRGVTAAEWIPTMNLAMAYTSVEAVILDGHEAARVVHQTSGDSAMFVIRANGRVYVITRELHAQPSHQPAGWFDLIAASFRAIPTQAPAAPLSSTPRCRL